MRTLLYFLLCVLPLGALLWLLSGGAAGAPDLPEEAGARNRAPLLVGADLMDAYGTTPFRGQVHRLENVVVQLVERQEGGGEYVRYYVAAGRLARVEGRPRFEGILVAWFNPPVDGRARLRLKMECPYAEGDASALVNAEDASSRVVRLGGGVVARDELGRPVAEVDSLLLHVDEERISGGGAVVLRTPDRKATIRGIGLDADLKARRATLARQVEAAVVFPRAGGSVTFSCEGAATVEAVGDEGQIRVHLSRNAQIVHPLGTARCPEIEALLERRGDEYRLASAKLSGGVEVDFDPAAARGLEHVEADTLELEGEDVVRLEGHVRAVRVGPVHEEFGLGARTLDVRAESLALRLRDSEAGGRTISEIAFSRGVSAVDREGAGHLIAGSLVFDALGRELGAWGGVEVRTPRGLLRSDRLRIIEEDATGPMRILLEGEKRIEYDAEGRLGPSAPRLRGRLLLTSAGPILFQQRGARVDVRAEGEIHASMGAAGVDCDLLTITIEGQAIREVLAEGQTRMREGDAGLEISCDRFTFDGSLARLRGSPATATEKTGRTVSARELLLLEAGAYEANGEVRVVTALDAAQPERTWTISCSFAAGAGGEGAAPSCVLARGRVVADGPDGEHIEGDSFGYDAAEARAVLLGSPARVLRGKGLSVVAPGFDLRIEGRRPVEASTRGPATVEFVSAPGERPPAGLEGLSFRRWHIEMDGPCHLQGEIARVPAGARLQAYDGKGALALSARAGSVRIVLLRTKEGFSPDRIEGGRGVEVVRKGDSPARVVARQLRYRAGTREVELLGDGSVEARGWESGIRYERLLFVLEKDGVDLKRASRVAVNPER